MAAYEYNPHSARFDVPNPHRVENVFLTACFAICFGAAIVLLIDARTIYFAHDLARFLRAIVSAITLLGFAATYVYLVMQQVRFFFGRGQPADLVPSLRADETGYRAADTSDRQIADAAALRQTLQQNAITYRVSDDPLDSLLYWMVRDLVYSPRVTQEHVRALFRTLLGIVFVLILFPVSLAGIHNPGAVGWIGCFYFVLTNVVVLAPLAGRRIRGTRFSQQIVIGFIVIAIVAPVIFASLVPPTGYALASVIHIVPLTFSILIVALTVTAMAFRAGMATTVRPTQIAIAPHLETPSANCTPAQVYTELARELQRLWQEQVPNRTYMRRLPDVSEPQGTFTADVIEETQPLPVDIEPMTLARAWRLSTTFWLVVVDVVCSILTLGGAALVTYGATVHNAYDELTTGGALVVVAAFGIRSANALWRRFEFTSRIYWVDWNGTYARAVTKIGALLSDRVHTERELVTVESMTLRVWVAEIDSVAFNTDRDRDVVAIRGLPNEAERLGRMLAAFARNQSSVVAPASSVDIARMQAMNAYNGDVRRVPPAPPTLNERPTEPLHVVGAASSERPRFCAACGVPALQDAAFCSACGKRLT